MVWLHKTIKAYRRGVEWRRSENIGSHYSGGSRGCVRGEGTTEATTFLQWSVYKHTAI